MGEAALDRALATGATLRAPISLCRQQLVDFLDLHFPTTLHADGKLAKDAARAEQATEQCTRIVASARAARASLPPTADAAGIAAADAAVASDGARSGTRSLRRI